MSLLFDRRGSVTLQHPWERLFFRQVEVSLGRGDRGPALLLVDLDGEEVTVGPERVVKVELEPSPYRPGRTKAFRGPRSKLE